MKNTVVLLFMTMACTSIVRGQEFNKAINKDSLVKIIIKNLPEDKKSEFLTQYNSGNEQAKEFLILMFSMPRSSKKELIANIDSNYEKVLLLKTEYKKLVPKDCIVSIEFNQADRLTNTPENIDLRIERKLDNDSVVSQDWNMAYHSEKLDDMLKVIDWNYKTLATIKNLLTSAHCVSIENREITGIGFARSGLGKYSYLLFDKDLSGKQIKEYNNGCSTIFYKKNIVLAYGGGAIGPQCFVD